MRNVMNLVACGVMGLLVACNQTPENPVKVAGAPPVYPDYVGVSVPVEIAPLNFSVEEADRVDVVVKGRQGELRANGRYADFNIDEWHRLLEAHQGEALTFTVCARKEGQWVQYDDFQINVSPYPLEEWGLTYRRIAPGYVNYSKMGLYQRCLSDFTENAILENTAIEGGCINCHASNKTRPDRFTFHVRGPHGATMVQVDGRREWIDTKTDQTLGTCVYPYWHPSGRYIAFSTNRTNQAFHGINNERVEVFDRGSDLQVYDTETHELLLSPLLKTDDWMETYPVFSPDGKTLYFSTSRQYDDIATHFKDIKYNLCAIAFDAETGSFGEQVDTLFNAEAQGMSAIHPRPSYDGRYLMFTTCDYGCFPIWHEESDQWLLDLQTMEAKPMDAANSPRADSYHNWSLNSRWIVFTSRRENGLNSLLYLASIDEAGNISKPFLLPQRNPQEYYDRSVYSFNTPDFTLTPVAFDSRSASQEALAPDRTSLKARYANGMKGE